MDCIAGRKSRTLGLIPASRAGIPRRTYLRRAPRATFMKGVGEKDMNGFRRLLLAEGVYFFLTGLWPVVHLPSFIAVTGPKRDLWLVRTVGLLIGSPSSR